MPWYSQENALGLRAMNAIPTHAAVIVAAGRGLRMGQQAGAVPKAYLPLAGKPVVAHSLQALASLPAMARVIIVHHPDDQDLARFLTTMDERVRLIAGGATRTESVAAGLYALADVQPDWVWIHDAARPLLRRRLLDDLLGSLQSMPELDGLCPATPITDALKRVDGADQPIAGVARDDLRAVQTPQVFRYHKILPLYHQSPLPMAEDDMALAAAGGLNLGLVAGDGDNLKITYAEDLKQAEWLLNAGQVRHYRVGQGVDVHG
ncbi:MAG: 2-C-methyl-D-erythritol 4-phosphate cytidylyltransferase, partial [Alphaproteobacteria bacterium]|nr:2-C-methyl-D-erythritol 4-phosphate cytidylyltransferase [Alphaproteobacteria bacterium]